MTFDQGQRFRETEAAARGKYRRLFVRLMARRDDKWQTTFEEIEGVLGFTLPASARLHRPWWANQENGGGHSQALAWTAAGWKTSKVDMSAGTLVFIRKISALTSTADRSRFNLDEVLPVHHAGAWPEGLSLRREDMYRERI